MGKKGKYEGIGRAHGVMWHHFWDRNDKKHPYILGALDADQLAQEIEFLGRERILDPETWIEKALENKLDKKDICLTFDDNLLSQYEIAFEVMKNYNLKGFYFVYSSVFEGKHGKLEIYRFFMNKFFDDFNSFFQAWLNFESPWREQINRELENFDGEYLKAFDYYSRAERAFRYIRDIVLKKERYEEIMDEMITKYINADELVKDIWMRDEHLKGLFSERNVIGLHTYSHPTRLEDLGREEQEEEYKKNLIHLNKLFKHKYLTMSHPSNSYNDETLEILKNMGVVVGFRSNSEKEKERSIFELPRVDHNYVFKLMQK